MCARVAKSSTDKATTATTGRRRPGQSRRAPDAARHPSKGNDADGSQLFAAALPPLRPAFFFWAVVPPCLLSPPLPLCFPPCLLDCGALAILAARALDIPLSLSACYCLSFLSF